jgi:integrase/recombinase XerD
MVRWPKFRNRAKHAQKPIVADPKRPGALRTLMVGYLDHLKMRHFSADTLHLRERLLYLFAEWCQERGVTDAGQVTLGVLERYQRYLAFQYRKKDGEFLSIQGQLGRLAPLRAFFRWCVRGRYLGANPAADMELPRKPHRLPRVILTAQEIAAIFAQPDLSTHKGIRDRAMLEVLYSTGMRRMELAGLKIDDVQIQQGLVLIREGKGRKDRYVPIGNSALGWMEKYLADTRPHLATEPDAGFIFLNVAGEPLDRSGLAVELKTYIEAAGVQKRGSCHLFRHAFATHLLEAGCDVRFIQDMLGHESLETTALYTQVAITTLKTMHSMFHPQETGKAGHLFSSAAAVVASPSAAEETRRP